MNVYRTHILIIIFFILVFALLTFLGVRGIVYSDEGYILYGAERILSGQVPYKDFHFAYTPFSLYATAASFMVFGKSIVAGRILMIGIALVTGILLFFLYRRITKNIIISFIGILFYIVWACFHANFPWPVLFAAPLGIASCFFLVLGGETRNKKAVLLSGIFSFFVLFTKQNFGAVMLITYVAALASIPVLRKKELAGEYLLGFFIPGFLYIGYLVLTNSLIPFFNDFYVYTLRRIILEQTLTTSFLLGETVPEIVAKLFFYTLPLLIGVLAGYFTYLKKRTYVFLCVFVCLFYIVGIRPTTDYIHLTPLFGLIGIPLVVLWETTKKSSIKMGILFSSILLLLLGLYSSLYRGYYRWEPPLISQTELLAIPKTTVYLDSYHKKQLEQLKHLIDKKTIPTDQIFVNGYIPMLYFITNRTNPTAYDLLEPTEFYIDAEKEIIKKLQTKEIKIVITRGIPGKNYLGEYIKKEYNKTALVNDFLIWKKK